MLRTQQGILSPTTNPVLDADVIMTAAIVGHAYQRLRKNKDCCFDAEVKLNEQEKIIDGRRQELDNLQSAVSKINLALAPELGTQRPLARVGITPIYDPDGEVVRISGGTGDLPADDLLRYYPDMPKGWSLELYKLTKRTGEDAIGYQGRGAYTGLVDAREGGQSALMPTIRIIATEVTTQERWLPTEQSYAAGKRLNLDTDLMGAGLGAGDNERTWGMIVDNAMQATLRQQQMHFEEKATPDPAKDVVGYTHGMIQAIYDVRMWESQQGAGSGGTPYEIAVGTETFKLASCFPCAIFMEATGFPASSTHLGKGESWCPLHPVNHPVSNVQDRARKQCNDEWAVYCQTILVSGIQIISRGGRVRPDHAESLKILENKKLQRSSGYTSANLILDAITVHDKEENRIKRTLLPDSRTNAARE